MGGVLQAALERSREEDWRPARNAVLDKAELQRLWWARSWPPVVVLCML